MVLIPSAVGFGSGIAAYKLMDNANDKVILQTIQSQTIPTSSEPTKTNVAEVAAAIKDTVVEISTEYVVTSSFFSNYVTTGAGSGVIYTKDGYIVTCAHVVDGASKIVVTTSDQQQYSATLIGSDSSQDIAVLKIDATDLTPATFADSSKIAQGSTTYAVGNPEGRLSNSVTSGIISATSRSIEVATGSNSNSMYQNTIKLTVIQTDAAVSPGNSGGGLFDAKGNLIGLVSAKSVQSGSEGLAFAIHSNTVKTIAQKLMK
jgi:serine protease Do